MVWLAIIIAGISMLLIPFGMIYLGIQKKKGNTKYDDDKVKGKFLLTIRIISIVLFVVALLILTGLMKDLQTTS